MSPERMENIIRNIKRIPRQRTTLYTTPGEKMLKKYNASFEVGHDSLAQSI
jgi:hypothetical protein